jgi:hypothetical protein
MSGSQPFVPEHDGGDVPNRQTGLHLTWFYEVLAMHKFNLSNHLKAECGVFPK